jgi:hypothetical protein
MKRTLYVLSIVFFMSSYVGCEQAQQALGTIDKAKSFKDDIEKKFKEVANTAKDFIPGGAKEKKGKGQDAIEEGPEKDD